MLSKISEGTSWVSNHSNKIILSVAIGLALAALIELGLAVGATTSSHFMNMHAFTHLQHYMQRWYDLTPGPVKAAFATHALFETMTKVGYITSGAAGAVALGLGVLVALRKIRQLQKEGSAIQAFRQWCSAHKADLLAAAIIAAGALILTAGIGFTTCGSMGLHLYDAHLSSLWNLDAYSGALNKAMEASNLLYNASLYMMLSGVGAITVGLALSAGTGIGWVIRRFDKVTEAREELVYSKGKSNQHIGNL